jgi:tetratricopeptide (TPR) repeat protein
MQELMELDVTDSMRRNIAVLSRAIDAIEGADEEGKRKMLEQIHMKIVEAEEYFWRPIDSQEIYQRLKSIASQLEDKSKAGHYDSQIYQFKANELEFMGRVQDFFGNKVKALEFYAQALELVPDHELAKPAHEKALKNVEKARSELTAIERKLQLKEDDAKLWYRCGVALISLGEVERAIQCLDRAIELDPSYPDAWARRGTATESLGDYEEARKYLDKALDLKPKSMIAKRGLNYAEYFLDH